MAPLVPLPHPGDGDEGHGTGVDDLGDPTDDGVDRSGDYPDAEPDADFR